MAAVGSYSVKCVLTSTRSSEMTVHTVEDHSCKGGFSPTLEVSKSLHEKLMCLHVRVHVAITEYGCHYCNDYMEYAVLYL